MGTTITILVLVAVIVVALAILERWARGIPKRRLRAAAVNGPVCGACAHPVAQPHTTRCPECGDTYAHAGIFTRALEIRVGPPLVTTSLVSILVSLFLGLMLTGLVFGFMVSTLPVNVIGQLTQTHGYTPSATHHATTRPAPRYIFEVAHDIPAPSASATAMPTSGTITIRLLGAPDTGANAVYDIASGTWTLTDTNGSVLDSGNDFADAAEAIMRVSGLDNAWDGSQREVEDARLIAQEATLSTTPPAGLPGSNSFGLDNTSSSTSFSSTTGFTSGSSSGTPTLLWIGAFAIGAFPVLCSIVFIVVKAVRHRRILKPITASHAA